MDSGEWSHGRLFLVPPQPMQVPTTQFRIGSKMGASRKSTTSQLFLHKGESIRSHRSASSSDTEDERLAHMYMNRMSISMRKQIQKKKQNAFKTQLNEINKQMSPVGPWLNRPQMPSVTPLTDVHSSKTPNNDADSLRKADVKTTNTGSANEKPMQKK